MLPESTEANPYTFNFNINLSNVSDASAANETKVISHQDQNQKLTEKKIEAAPIAIPVARPLIPESISSYKWHIAVALAVGSYGLLCYYAIKGNSYLKKADLWSSWRKELTIDDLLAISQQKFAQDLMQEIQQRYEKDVTTSLILFIRAIEQEEKDLAWYQSFYAWISYIHIQRLLFIDTKLYGQIAHRLQRLAYYRGCIDSLIKS